jgi:hypothetical protein
MRRIGAAWRLVKSASIAVALRWNYPAITSVFSDSLRVSGAVPGQVGKRLRSEFGDIPILLLQGFSET